MRLGAMAFVLLALAGFFTYLTNRSGGGSGGGGDMALLYGELDPAEGGKIITKLESLNMAMQVKGNGSEIYVHKDQVGRLRMLLAEMGLPAGGSIGYEIFDRSDTLGISSFTQDINHLRALEGELSRSIRTISSVASARVHLVLPRRELFSRDRQEPSASIVLKMRGTLRLSPAQVDAVAHLVASAVPGLSSDNISIIDSKGSLLARGGDDKRKPGVGKGLSPSTVEEMRASFESRIAHTIEELLEKSIGMGKVRAEVSAEMDFDHYSENAEVYDPDGQVVRSTQSAQESSSSPDGNQQSVTVENNLPGGAGAGTGGAGNAQSNRNEETINYEISKTVKTHVREVGSLKRLSVAVVVDGTYALEGGKLLYKPRPAEELAQLTKLIRSAVGYQQNRGDVVEVLNLQFVHEGEELKEEKLSVLGLKREDVVRLAELGVIMIIALLVILMVVRPLMVRILEIRREAQAAVVAEAVASSQALQGVAAGAEGAEATPKEEENEALTAMLSLDRVDGRVKASSIKKISEIIEKHPEEALATIRSWMSQTGASTY